MSAVAAAKKFGYGKGSPIYFDMEGYKSGGGCSSAVLNFLSGWTHQLHAAGYVSGVYSSAASGIKDLAAAYGKRSKYLRPDDIWIADWTGKPVLTDPFVPNSDWANHQRLHQYSGPHDEKWGGDTLNIDTDAADGLVVGKLAVPDIPRPAESALPSELAVAPGKTASVKLTLRSTSRTAANVQWRVGAPRGMSANPGLGTVDLRPGALYSVTVSLTPAASLAPGRYLVPITLTSGSHAVADAFVLVSVVRPGASLPTRYPLLLYAAGRQRHGDRGPGRPLSGAAARRCDRQFQPGMAGHGQQQGPGACRRSPAAANALYFNACGWTDPGGCARWLHSVLLSRVLSAAEPAG